MPSKGPVRKADAIMLSDGSHHADRLVDSERTDPRYQFVVATFDHGLVANDIEATPALDRPLHDRGGRALPVGVTFAYNNGSLVPPRVRSGCDPLRLCWTSDADIGVRERA